MKNRLGDLNLNLGMGLSMAPIQTLPASTSNFDGILDTTSYGKYGLILLAVGLLFLLKSK